MTFRIFISSVQDEFAEERRRLKEWLTTDLFVSRFVESVFLFEDVPSRGTGIKRMIETCRKEGLPDPTWEQNGSADHYRQDRTSRQQEDRRILREG